MKIKVHHLLAQLLVAAVALEVLSWYTSKQNLLLFNAAPAAYGIKQSEPNRTERHPWGAWREPYNTSRHRTLCFDVEVSTNELGARDDSFLNAPSQSVVLLGDSFAEGYGVSHADSAATIIEKQIDVPVHNLGSSGNFGPLQTYLAYEHFRDIIKHNRVLIFMLPANDFTDNDISFWSGAPAQRKRYRPYYGSRDAVSPVYHEEAVPSDQIDYGATLVKRLEKTLVRYTWSANALRTLKHLIAPPEPIFEENRIVSFYEKATTEQQMNLVAAYQAISASAEPRPISIVLIPDQRDIDYYVVKASERVYKTQIWFTALKDITKNSGGKFVDLLDHIPDEHMNLFHSCDGHWSMSGNKWASSVILDVVFEPSKKN